MNGAHVTARYLRSCTPSFQRYQARVHPRETESLPVHGSDPPARSLKDCARFHITFKYKEYYLHDAKFHQNKMLYMSLLLGIAVVILYSHFGGIL